MNTLTEREAYEQYDQMIDEVSEPCRVGEIVFDASYVLKELDPIAYEVGFSDWLDNDDVEVED